MLIALSEKLSQWGLNSSKQAVVYDDAGGAFAGRMWWILKWLGHTNVAILDGALGGWMASGGKLTQDSTQFLKDQFLPRMSKTICMYLLMM